MRTILAALVTLGMLGTAVPASAGYISPEAPWQEQVFQLGQ